MSRFAQQFARAGARNLLRQFGETVTYHPANGGETRSITALVERRPPQVIPETGDIVGQTIIVRALNDADEGILSTEVDTATSKISVAIRVGDTASVRQIQQVTNDANGLTRVVCQ